MKSISNRVFRSLIVLCGLLFGPANVQAGVTEAWVHRYSNVVSNSVDWALKAALDSAGDIIVTGISDDNLSGPDMLTIKYSGADGSVLWLQRQRYNGRAAAQNKIVSAVVVDRSDNVIVTGASSGGEEVSDYFTVKYGAADGKVLWNRRYDGEGNSDDYATAVAVDLQGNVVVTGFSWFSSAAEYRSYTAKYAAEDGAILWEHRGPSGGASALAIDAGGNVVVTGYSFGESRFQNDFHTVKYAAANGALLWENRVTNVVTVAGDYAVALDANGNVVVNGMLVERSETGSQHFTAKYAAATGALLWEKRSLGGESGSVIIDGEGNILVASSAVREYAAATGALLWEGPFGLSYFSTPALAFDGNDNVVVTGTTAADWGSGDYYTAKYARADGALLWDKRYNGPADGDDRPSAVLVNRSGDVIVTGYSRKGPTKADFYTAKYAARDGALLWEKRYNGSASHAAEARAIAVDSNGNVLVTGLALIGEEYDYGYTAKYAAVDGALIWKKNSPGVGTQVVLDGSDNLVTTGYTFGSDLSYGFYTAKYAPDGQLLWEKRYNGSANSDDWANAVALDSNDNVVVTGRSSGDYYTAKYAAGDGGLLWEKRYNGPANSDDQALAVAVDRDGNVVVTGYSNGSPSIWNKYDYYTAKYASSDGALLWEQRYNSPDDGRDEATAVAIDGSGNVVVTGRSAHGGTVGNWLHYDSYTAKYDSSNGALIWEKRYAGTSNLPAFASGLAVNGSGDVVVTGSPAALKLAAANGALLWEKNFTFGRGKSVAIDGSDNVVVLGTILNEGSLITAKYAANGDPLWEKRYNESAGEGRNWLNTPHALALGPNGTVAITASSYPVQRPVSAHVTVVYRETIPPLSIEIIPTGARLRSAGISGLSYKLERASSVTGPWSAIDTQTALQSGFLEYLDTNPHPGSGFYRTTAP